MRHLICAALCYLFIANSYCQERKALFVIVDGIAADVLEKLKTPNIDEISKRGGYRRVIVGGEKGGYSQTPTISAVGYNTVLTGTWVNKHNVWDNDIAAPNYHYKTIFHFLKEQDNSKKIGIFSSWLDNRTKLVNRDFDYKFDGLELDTVNFPHDDDRAFMKKIDEAVTDSAASCIRLKAPDLSWVYLEYTDDLGHMYGDDPRYYASVENMDNLIGKLWSAVKYREQEFKEDWLIFITTDHGRDSATGKHHGGQSDRERLGWIVTNAKNLNEYFKKGKPSIADIMPTIARFMDIKIPKKDAMEIDGIPLTGKVAASEPSAQIKGEKITVRWKKIIGNGNMKIWLSRTNNYKSGEADNYVLLKTVPLHSQTAQIDVGNNKSSFYKLVFESPTHFMNRWIVEKNTTSKNN